jgi:hypothetical protein
MQARYLSLFVSAVALTAAAQAFAQDVRAPNSNPEPLTPIYMEYEGVNGESSPPPPPPPPPPSAPPAEPGVQAQPQQARIGLLLPAVQKAQAPAAAAERPIMDGVVVLNAEQAPAPAARGTGTLTLSNGNGPALVPEMPICANCGADAQAQARHQAPEERPQRRRAPDFSFSIGGVSIGSGGVSVAAGVVDGDGRGESRRRPERRSDGRR